MVEMDTNTRDNMHNDVHMLLDELHVSIADEYPRSANDKNFRRSAIIKWSVCRDFKIAKICFY
ncbi:hypothetical protein G9C98_005714 [Cotesia typhae]|uniref:Uncharacterized protein n=1 Tax=Cotesia typhae TaxID=2053667 RepID=A0A8J5V816_9HYME|nr:hypothetical protein G9C98_005714 [Cotesia typhae]